MKSSCFDKSLAEFIIGVAVTPHLKSELIESTVEKVGFVLDYTMKGAVHSD